MQIIANVNEPPLTATSPQRHFFFFFFFWRTVHTLTLSASLHVNESGNRNARNFCQWNQRENLHVESGILGRGIQNTAKGIRYPTVKDWNLVNGIRNPVYGVWNPEFKTVLDSLNGVMHALSALACSTRNLFQKLSNMRCNNTQGVDKRSR